MGGPEAIIVLVIVLVLFGGSQIPKLARNLGRAQKEFKDGMDDGAGGPSAGFADVGVATQRHRHHRHVEQRADVRDAGRRSGLYRPASRSVCA